MKRAIKNRRPIRVELHPNVLKTLDAPPLPKAADRVVLKATREQPAERYASVDAMASDLAQGQRHTRSGSRFQDSVE